LHSGTNGSQLWDCAFITQALVESGLAMKPENHASAIKALEWLDDCQIKKNPKWHKEAYRQATKGAWPFSTRQQGYTVSDCTAEGLKSVLMLQRLPSVVFSPFQASSLIFSNPQLYTQTRLKGAIAGRCRHHALYAKSWRRFC